MAEKKPSSQYQKNKSNRKPRTQCVNKPSNAKDVRINLRRAKFRQKPDSDSEEFESKQYSLAPQPETRWLSYDDIPVAEEEGKNFESLLNVPISADGHFSFKGEKDWNFDISQSSEFFSIDLKLLNAAVSCIRFNEFIGLEDAYFSKDQLTYIRSVAETAKKDYETITRDLSNSEMTTPNESIQKKSENIPDTRIAKTFQKRGEQKSKRTENLKSADLESLKDDLDSLLTLKEPFFSRPTTIPQSVSSSKLEEPKCKSATVPTKSIDLEKWLDSVLDV